VLADALVGHGITHAFCVPGESYLDVLDGLHAVRDKIALVTCRFEAGAAHMADAQARLTGRPAAAFVTRGPGACHAAIGVHVAAQDSTPMLLFVGQIPFAETDRESFQELNYRQVFGGMAKWVTQIDDATRIPELVAHAVDVATSGRPGPVVIALSEEMQKHVVDVADIGPAPPHHPHPDPEAMERLAALLAGARRPLAILGGGFRTATGRADIATFLRAHDIATAVAFRRQALYDGTLANYAGDLGVGADPALVAAAREADLILAIGTRLGEAVSQGYTLFGGGQTLVHIHRDGAEIGRVFRADLGIVADLDAFAARAAALPAPEAIPWRDWTARLRRARLAQAVPPDYAGPLNLGVVLNQLQGLLEPDAVMTVDAGNFATWPPRFMQFSDRQRFIGTTCGAMGYAVPAAVGAAITFPGRQCVAFVGDGGCLMTGQELATAVLHGAAPIILIFDNGMYGTIRMYQERAYPGRVSGTTLANPDFAAWGRAFGAHAETVTATDEFVPAWERAVASGRPAVIVLRINPDQITSRATIDDLRRTA
jgi:acetolactate synthase-1/2/3 large subunit